jgi:hypothetical protein
MTTNSVEQASSDGQINKSRLSDGCGAIILPSVAEFAYDRLLIDGYPGNVGLFKRIIEEAGGAERYRRRAKSIARREDAVMGRHEG